MRPIDLFFSIKSFVFKSFFIHPASSFALSYHGVTKLNHRHRNGIGKVYRLEEII